MEENVIQKNLFGGRFEDIYSSNKFFFFSFVIVTSTLENCDEEEAQSGRGNVRIRRRMPRQAFVRPSTELADEQQREKTHREER